MKSLFLLFCFLMAPLSLYAAGDGIPYATIFSQLSNLAILLAGVFFASRKAIVAAFADKKSNYLDQLNAASAAKTAAEEKLREVTARLAEIRATADQQLKKAERQALDEAKEIVAQSKEEALRLVSAAQAGVEYEAQKMVEALRLEAFHKSASLAEKNLRETLTPEQQKAWNSHFAEAREMH